MFWLGFLAGLIVGACFGVLVIGMCIVAGDEKMPRKEDER